MTTPMARSKKRHFTAAFFMAALVVLFTGQLAYTAPALTNQCPRPSQPTLPPAGAPTGPTDWLNFSTLGLGFTSEYTYLGLPIVDHETSSDPTNGGTAVQPDNIDLASGSPDGNPGQYTTPFYGYYDGGTLYDPDNPDTMNDDFVLFRMRLESDPSAKDGFISRHWNILVDIDADGYKEYWVDVDGSFVSKDGPDLLQVLYNNDNTQYVSDPDASRVYSFDAYNDGTNPASYTRVYPALDGVDSDYWLEVQIPLWAFLDIDSSGTAGCVQQVTPDSPVGFVFSTSSSNTDPLQKDWMMDLDFISMADPITFGDIVTISGEPRLYFADSSLQEVFYYTAAVDQATPGDDIYTYVKHVAGNTDSNATEFITVTVTNPRTGDDEQLTLVESTPSSGLFTNRGGADKPDTTGSPDAWIPGVTTSPLTDDAYWEVRYNSGLGEWQVYKDGGLQGGTATAGTEYTSDDGEITFTLYETNPTNGDTITFDTYAAIPLSQVIDNLAADDSDNTGSLETSSLDRVQFSYNTGSRTYTTEADIVGEGVPYIKFTRANGTPSTDFQLTDDTSTSDKLYVTVYHDPGLYSLGSVDIIQVTLSGNDGYTLTLEETGPDTGIFRNVTGLDTLIDTDPFSINTGDDIWEDVDDGTVTATYNYDGTDYSTPSTLFYILYGGRVRFTNSSGTVDIERYTAGEDLYITLDETFSAGDCGDTDPVQVTVSSPWDSAIIDLHETPSDSATYRNSSNPLTTAVYDGSSSPVDGILEANHGDVLTVTYDDCKDGDNDAGNDIKTDTALFNSPTIMLNEVFFYPDLTSIPVQTEYFQIYNSTGSAVPITGYTVEDGDGFSYTFPADPDTGGTLSLPSGDVAYVFLYDSDLSSYNFYDSGTGAYYLFTDGGGLPSDQFGDPDDPGSDPAKPDENKADQLTLRDTLGTVIDYVGWSYTPLPSVDFQGDDSPAVIQSIWQDDAFKIVYDTDPDPGVDTSIQYGSAITRSSLGFDTDKPSDWIYKDVAFLFEEGSPLITQAIIRSFSASLEDGQIVLSWETASEIGTLGFYLYRRDREKFYYELVNENLLPGNITSQQGGIYTYVDSDADPDIKYEYLLEEVEISSNRNTYGPYKIKLNSENRNTSSKKFKRKFKRTLRLDRTAADNDSIDPRKRKMNGIEKKGGKAKRSADPDSEANSLKISILEAGLYEIGAQTIADLLSIPVESIRSRIDKRRIKLTNMGREIAYQPMPGSNGIYFYGQELDSVYAVDNIYWLTLDRGSMMSRLKLDKNTLTGPAEKSFTSSLHIEEDVMPILSQNIDTSKDYWVWNYIFSGFEGFDTLTLPFEIAALDTSADNAMIALNFIGGSMESAGNDHHAEIFVNDQPVAGGDCFWKGIEKYTCKLPVPVTLLKEGSNELTINGILEGDVGFSVFYLDSFDISYERLYQSKDNSLLFTDKNNSALEISGFDSAGIYILDLTRPDMPLFSAEQAAFDGETYTLRFRTREPTEKLFTVAASAIKPAAAIEPHSSSRQSLEKNSAEYLVISPAELYDTAQNLADYRASQGMEVKTVLLDDLIAEFNFGLASPEAIRNYLSFAHKFWGNKLKYVVIIGDGTTDYKDIMGFGGNLMPPLMVTTPTGVFPSDNALADVTGDSLPDFAIGRIPASTPAELQAVIDKIIQYENNTGPWKEKALLLADNQYDDDYGFEFSSNRISRLLPNSYKLDMIHLSGLDIDTAREELIDGLNSGAALTNFFGHAGLDSMGQQGLLLYTDVDALNSDQGSPVLTAMTCGMGQFSFTYFDTLAEMLVVKENGGATAVWTSSGLSDNTEARILDAEFYRALFEDGEDVLGDAILAALNAYAESGSQPYHIMIYNLLGDPALRMK